MRAAAAASGEAIEDEVEVDLDAVGDLDVDWSEWTPPGHDRSIVNVASAAGLIGFANLPAYVASKHGVVGLTKSVALEYARKGVRINAVCPGTVRTPMLRGFAGSDEAIDAMAAPSPIGRAAEPQEIAQAILWLCSPAASYVTGQALAVDGGVLAT
jgi:NAD(P)-dependent dehydrogenase (short-subunit alcohol dehydrogenase family)